MKRVYIVTHGEYSDYHICAVFENKEKANAYQCCHPNTYIEEWELDDDRIYTAFNVVLVTCQLYNESNFDIVPKKTEIKFATYSTEDDGDMFDDEYWLNMFSSKYIDFGFRRKLPDTYDKDKVEDKYSKVVNDIAAEIEYEIKMNPYSSLTELESNLRNILKNKF